MLNEIISSKLPGNPSVFRSADELLNRQDLLRFNAEYLNSLNPNGFPPHALNLKPGMLLMLLRNLNPREGLCNGTKLVYVRSFENKVLQCKVSGTDRTVLIPRIVMFPKVGEYPFEWSRRQFPVKPAFAMTVNKSQGKSFLEFIVLYHHNLTFFSGQTLKEVGLWLRTQSFTHGQLYVACSRVGKPERLKFALKQESNGDLVKATNIVFKEVLLNN